MGLGKAGIQEKKNEKGREGLTGERRLTGKKSVGEIRWGIAWHRERERVIKVEAWEAGTEKMKGVGRMKCGGRRKEGGYRVGGC